MVSCFDMSRTFTLVGTSSILKAEYYPPIVLNPNYEYCLGLIGFHTYNTISNIEEGVNNFFYYKDNQSATFKKIIIPGGTYEITDIESYLQTQLLHQFEDIKKLEAVPDLLSIQANNNTLKVEIISKYYGIDFTQSGSIGSLLGFSNHHEILKANKLYSSDQPVSINKITSLRVECNLVKDSYYGSHSSHTIFEFAPDVEPGYALNKEPKNIIYLPINNTTQIDNISIKLVDQDGDLVNLRGEKLVIRVELKQNGHSI